MLYSLLKFLLISSFLTALEILKTLRTLRILLTLRALGASNNQRLIEKI
jgi:hypothetical protein